MRNLNTREALKQKLKAPAYTPHKHSPGVDDA